MKILVFLMLMIALAGISGCTEAPVSSIDESPAAESEEVEITSGNLTYPAYLSAPPTEGKKPAVVLIHSFRGLEPGYLNMTDNFASEGYVVLAPEWQTFGERPEDEVVGQLIEDSVAYLKSREDVAAGNIGLTGFCAGGRYTMLFLPQIDGLGSGVAWYGFPYRGDAENRSIPADVIDQLEVPMLMIHGTHDRPSPVDDIYRYATALNASDKYFELKVYQGEPHGFMIEEGQLSESFVAKDAFREMVTFFDRTLKK